MDTASNAYDISYERACNPATRNDFWNEWAQEVDWYTKPKTILDESNPPFYRWFKDGQLNMSYNCVDRHLNERPNQKALIWESGMLNQTREFTFQELYEHVSKLAGVMKTMGVNKGDRVIIYMPMIPEALFSMLATVRIGAIHSVVFGGFSAKELASRITDSQPSLVVCGSCGLEPNKVIDYKSLLDEALQISGYTSLNTLIVQREVHPTSKITIGRDYDYYTAMKFAQPAEPVPVDGDHPLYILYTSGTTGQPKGIVRDTGGTAVALTWTMRNIMDIKKGDVYFSASDIGWVVGHSFIVYGPLLAGATTSISHISIQVLFEGKPTLPDPGVYWRIIEKHKVVGMYTSPTGLRALRKEDPNGEWIHKSNTKSLQGLSMAGERCDVPTYEWIQSNLGVLINDNYWQTETGWIISCNFKGLHIFKPKPGSATKPSPGFQVEIMDHDNHPIHEPGKLGRICIKLPMPPSFMLTLYRNDEAFLKKYLLETPGYYTAGVALHNYSKDAGYYDQDGYLNVMTRIDDIINTAGHRLSTAAMEEVLLKHKDIVEAAVVAMKEDLKGEIPIGLVVIKQGHVIDAKIVEKELIALIRSEIGPVASFQHALVVERLPKTRSGKVLRGTLKKIVDGEEYKVPATIEDESVLERIKVTVLEYGFKDGRKALIYRDQLDNLAQDMTELVE